MLHGVSKYTYYSTSVLAFSVIVQWTGIQKFQVSIPVFFFFTCGTAAQRALWPPHS